MLKYAGEERYHGDPQLSRLLVSSSCPGATQEEIDDAARIACLTDVVERLPGAWKTELGPLGAGLSGGEKQRLAIMHALLQQRPILILDEAMSGLDALTESRLLLGLENWRASRMLIVVSHRIAAARWADRVIVMSRGQVVEEGSHDLLYRPDTHYGALSRHPSVAAIENRESLDLFQEKSR